MKSACATGPDRTPIYWAVLTAVLFVAAQLPGLTLTPMVMSDEATLNCAARNWQERGTIAMPLFGGREGNPWNEHYFWQPPAHMIVVSAAYRVCGFSLGTTRGVPLCFGGLAMALLVVLVFRLGGTAATAVTCALLFAADELFWRINRSGRMDPEALCFGIAAVYVWLGPNSTEQHAPPLSRTMLAGLLIGLGSTFHVLTLVFGPALVAADWAMRRRCAWAAWTASAAFAALPLLAWLAWIFWRQLGPIWVVQFWQQQVVLRAAHGSWWTRPAEELALFLSQNRFAPCYVVALLAGWAAWLGTRQWRDPRQRFVAGGLACALVLITFAMGKGTGAYPLYWRAWGVLVAACGWSALLKAASPSRRKLGTALLAGALANSFAWQALLVGVAYYQYDGRNYDAPARFVAQNVPAGAVVCGDPAFWYATAQNGDILRIWREPNSREHDFCLTPLSQPAPPGFRFVASLPDRLRTFHGAYLTYVRYSGNLWISEASRFSSAAQPTAERPPAPSKAAAP